MSYENVYREDNRNENIGTINMLRMRADADVVIEEDSSENYNITKPTAGYHGLTKVDNPFLFAQNNPQTSVLFIRYAGGFTRYNWVGLTTPVNKVIATLGEGSTAKIDSVFYNKETNTYELNVIGTGATPGTIDSSLFNVTKYAQLSLKNLIQVGKNTVVQINPVLAEYSSDPSISKNADDKWMKVKSYTVESADDYALQIPGVRTDVIVKHTFNGITTTYVIHCNVTYAA